MPPSSNGRYDDYDTYNIGNIENYDPEIMDMEGEDDEYDYEDDESYSDAMEIMEQDDLALLENIVDAAIIDNTIRYRSRWVGVSADQDTWEPEEIFRGLLELNNLLNEFQQQNPEKMENLRNQLKQNESGKYERSGSGNVLRENRAEENY